MNYNCLIVIREELFYKIRSYIGDRVEFIIKEKLSNNVVRSNNVRCVILFHEKHQQFTNNDILVFKKNFPLIPVISIFSERCLESARECGKYGIDKILHYSEFLSFTNELMNLIDEKSVKVTLKDIGVRIKNCSKIIQDALIIIENNYLELSEIKDVSRMLEINVCTLSREFRKYKVLNPKKILMYLKVYHASLLLRNNGLRISEVADLAGFTSLQNFQYAKKQMRIYTNELNNKENDDVKCGPVCQKTV